MTPDETEPTAGDHEESDESDETDPTTGDHEESDEPTREPADSEKSTIRAGRNFEEAYRLSTAEAGEFLVQLGEGLENGDELTLETDEWELPFAFGEPATLEVDYEGVDEPELEIELELSGRSDDEPPAVN